MKKIHPLILSVLMILLLLSGLGPLFAETSAEVYGLRIGEIEISGNTRTRDRTILRIGRVETGEILGPGTITRLEDNLIKSGLFARSSVGVEALPDRTVRLAIEVEEKWTLLPIPVFFSDGDSIMGGVVVIESNLAGTAKQLISGVMGGTDGLSGFAVYVDPAVRQSSWKITVSGGAGTQEEEIDTPDGEFAYLIQGESLSASFGLGYAFDERLEIGGRVRIQDYIADTIEGISLPADTYLEQQFSLQGRWDTTRPYGALLRGIDVLLESGILFQSAEVIHRGTAAWFVPTAAGQRLRLLLQGGYGEKPFYLEDPVSGRDGFRTLPFGKATADDYISVSAGYDVPVLERSWGALVLTGFYELGWYSASYVGSHLFQGPGGGFRVYLQKVAVPALGLDLAYNLESDALVFSVALGMRM
ncbi:MAG: POTRA domain-containing protein [Sediminispirochaetaceae bacterium]